MTKNILIATLLLAGSLTASAVNQVKVVYSGTTATVTIDSNIASYITVSSGTSSHVVITQSDSFEGNTQGDGEIEYILSGSSTDGEFYLTGSYKCTVELKGLTLTNPSGPALNLQNGKRVAISAKNGTTNTLTDASNSDYKGCIHCKGHLKLKGKGDLTVVGKSAHAIYAKEYCEVKNLTLNITAAVKDGIHCQQYFLMESGTVSITGATDDGIQVELKGDSSTGTTTDHEDEDTGNFYMEDGTLTISNYGGKAIKADGTITYNGGTQNFDTTDTKDSTTGIQAVTTATTDATTAVYDLGGRRASGQKPGILIIKKGNKTTKRLAQ